MERKNAMKQTRHATRKKRNVTSSRAYFLCCYANATLAGAKFIPDIIYWQEPSDDLFSE